MQPLYTGPYYTECPKIPSIRAGVKRADRVIKNMQLDHSPQQDYINITKKITRIKKIIIIKNQYVY